MEGKKKRCAKTTRQQYTIYLEELQNNESFRCNKFSAQNPNILDETWENLTTSLNSSGGSQKSTSVWKRIFTDWKSSVRKRARIIKLAQTQTGGGPPEKKVSDIELKLIEIIGKISIDGMPGVPEPGIDVTAEKDEVPREVVDLQPTTPKVHSGQRSIAFGENVETPTTSNKTHKSLASTVKEIINKQSDDATLKELFTNIDNNLTKLVEIEDKRLQVELLKLQLKHPDTEFRIE